MIAQRINNIDNKIAELESEKKSYMEMLNKIQTSELGLNTKSDLAGEDTFELIVKILKDFGGWVQAGQIRKRFQLLTGNELPSSTMRHHLREHEHKLFKRRGEQRFTEWKYIGNGS